MYGGQRYSPWSRDGSDRASYCDCVPLRPRPALVQETDGYRSTSKGSCTWIFVLWSYASELFATTNRQRNTADGMRIKPSLTTSYNEVGNVSNPTRPVKKRSESLDSGCERVPIISHRHLPIVYINSRLPYPLSQLRFTALHVTKKRQIVSSRAHTLGFRYLRYCEAEMLLLQCLSFGKNQNQVHIDVLMKLEMFEAYPLTSTYSPVTVAYR
jgi:hypothetical protein